MPEPVKHALVQFFADNGNVIHLTIAEYEILCDWFGIDYFDIH